MPGKSLEVDQLGSFSVPFQNVYTLTEEVFISTDGTRRRKPDDDVNKNDNDNNSAVLHYRAYNNNHALSNKKKLNHDDKESPPSTFIIKLIKRRHRENSKNDERQKQEREEEGKEEVAALQEASILRDIQKNNNNNISNNIVQLIDYYVDPDYIYMVLQDDFATNRTILDHLAMMKEDSYYSERDAQYIAKTILEILIQLHEYHHIVHCDLVPENILLKNEDGRSILLSNFSHAQKLRSQNGNNDDDFFLTTYVGGSSTNLSFMSPEIILGNKSYMNEKVDTWSIGCIIFLLLSGKYPFGKDNKTLIKDNIIHCKYNYHFENDNNDEEEELTLNPWDIISGSAKVVIRKLLVIDPNKRWSAKQALQSRWFSSSTKSSNNNKSSPESELKREVQPQQQLQQQQQKQQQHSHDDDERIIIKKDRVSLLRNRKSKTGGKRLSLAGGMKMKKGKSTSSSTVVVADKRLDNHNHIIDTTDITESTAAYDISETCFDDDDDEIDHNNNIQLLGW